MFVSAGLGLTVGMLIFAVAKGIYLGFPLALGYIYFFLLYTKKGIGPAELYGYSKRGAQKAFIVIPILLLIGCLVSLWMAAGTVASFVYYSLTLIKPSLFIFFAFIITSFISMLLGTAFGTVGTIGVILMVLARGGGVNPYVAGGAIISAIYVGDRCSPMSSAVYLLSSVTQTDAYDNVRMCLKTTVPPYALSLLLFLLVSVNNPLLSTESSLRQDLYNSFYLGYITFLPAILILALACFRVNIKISMLISTLAALALAIFVQGMPPQALPGMIWQGFALPPQNPLSSIIHGGGIWSMLKTSFILLTACSLTELLEGAGALTGLEKKLLWPCGRFKLFLKTTVVSLLGISCGCNQSIAILLTGELMKQPYLLNGLDNRSLARDISFTAIPLASVIPWTVASRVPMDALGLESAAHLPYMFFPFLVTIFYGSYYAVSERRSKKSRALI